MKIYAVIAIILFLVMLLAPLMSMNSGQETTSAVSETEQSVTQGEKIDVLMTSSGSVKSLDMRDYIIGVVASEMPAAYHEQAIMAQAVASYTYALAIKESGNVENADITDSSSSHQGYLNPDELKQKWGDKYDRHMEKISRAVDSVIGQYLEYDGKPIRATYHSLNSGRTESAKNIWGNEVAYLVSAESSGDTLSPQYSSVTVYTQEQFKQAATLLDKSLCFGDNPSEWFKDIKSTNALTVTSVTIGGKSFTGTQVRTAFSLKSAAFTLEYEDGKFTFTVFGSGHMVGMSQYGADYMARQGSTYKEILLHYYSGASLKV